MTAKPQAEKAADVELTEMADIDVERVDGVKAAANGFPILMIKSIAGEPEPAGNADAELPGCGCCGDCTMDTTKGQAEPDGGAFTPLTDAEREEVMATVKAVTSTGKVSEGPDIAMAQKVLVLLSKLIAAEAQEMATGEWDESRDIACLLEAVSCMKYFLAMETASDESTKSAAGSAAEESGIEKASQDDDPPVDGEKADLAKRLEKSETEATALKERMEALEAQLAKVLDTPIPGGPVITAPAAARKQRDDLDREVSKARYRRLADDTSDPDLKKFYTDLARKMEDE